MTTDTLTLLVHSTNLATKTWKPDGTIEAYGNGKFFSLTTRTVANLAELSQLLQILERKPRTLLIRGRYVGDEVARSRDPDFQHGAVRRSLDYFDDQPLHAVMLDVDRFVPLTCDALETPDEAVLEFVQTMLPMEWAGASYHWQLSSSFGHPSKVGDGLRAHLWFWLEQPVTSAQLKSWAASVGLPADAALFNPVQVHYTANPVFEGCSDPVGARSGYVQGYLSDSVEIDASAVESAAVVSGGRGQRMRDIAHDDPIAAALFERGMVKSPAQDGFNIECPFADEHSSDSGETSTQYRLPHTGGHARGQFICLHAHCRERGRGEFLARLGIDETEGDFTPVPAEPGAAAEGTPGVRAPRKVPKAQYLTTDLANANRIVESFGKHMIVVAGSWFGWDGRRWCKDDGEVYKRATDLSKVIRAEADGWRAKRADTDEERKKNRDIADSLDKWANKSEMKAVFEAGMGFVKKIHGRDESEVDANPWLLNCLNGTVDLRTGALKPHDPADLITKLCPVNYNPRARAPGWEETLARVTLEERGPARPLVAFLQRWFGYCATGSVREQQFLVHYGSGANGKSTVIDTVAAVLGDYAGVTAPGLLMSKGHESHPTEIADLFGRRMVTAHETGEGGVLREDFVKQATGGDKLKARYMRADFFEFSPTHKIQLLTNYKPIIRGQDTGIWRRVLLMPYLARFASAEDVAAGRAHHIKDTSILDRLAREQEGILAWVVTGARLWFQDGLQPPDAVLAASREYQAEQDRVGQFVSECCELAEDAEELFSGGADGFENSVFIAYSTWCKEGGMHPLSRHRFSQELQRAAFGVKVVETKRTAEGGRRKKLLVVRGLRLV